MHGYKAHVATDREAGLILGVEVTTANVHRAAMLEGVLADTPGEVFGDSAFNGSGPEAAIRARGGTPRNVHTGTWGGAAALARLEAHNAAVRRVRCRIEKVFGTAKRSYGLRRMRWLCLPRPGLQVRLTGRRLQSPARLASARGRARVTRACGPSAAARCTPRGSCQRRTCGRRRPSGDSTGSANWNSARKRHPRTGLIIPNSQCHQLPTTSP